MTVTEPSHTTRERPSDITAVMLTLLMFLATAAGCIQPEEGQFDSNDLPGDGSVGGRGLNTGVNCLEEDDDDDDHDREEDEGYSPPPASGGGSTATPAGGGGGGTNPCAGGGAAPSGGGGSGCMTGTFWTRGSSGSPEMLPGSDCMSCHREFSSAGTVFGAVDDVNNCFGVEGVAVEITDATGRDVTMFTNRAGNFYTNQRLTPPYTTRVTHQGRTREMLSSVSDFNCASCHTAAGRDGAPGRVFVP